MFHLDVFGDLCANRVVPYWVVGKAPHAISHAWVSDKERMDVQTPINWISMAYSDAERYGP